MPFLKLSKQLNPLMGTGNYSATSNNMKFVHWPLVGLLLHLVQRGGDWVGPQPAQASPRRIGPLLCGLNVLVKGLSSSSSSIRGRQLLNCLALRPPVGPNALPLINQLVS